MRKLALLLCIIMFAVPVLAEQATAPEAAVLENVTEGYQITETGLDINLWENGTTGYQWTFEIDDEGVIEYADEVLTAEEDGLMGAPSMHKWSFKVNNDGEALITFYYERSWETEGDEEIPPERTLCYTVNVEGKKVVDVLLEDLSDEGEFGDEEAVEVYDGETGGVEILIPQGMVRKQTEDGVQLVSEDGYTIILVEYDPADTVDELFEQLKDDASAAAIYNDEESGVSVISSNVELDAEVPFATLVLSTPTGFEVYNGYKAPNGGVLHMHTTYLVGEEEEFDWSEESEDWDELPELEEVAPPVAIDATKAPEVTETLG